MQQPGLELVPLSNAKTASNIVTHNATAMVLVILFLLLPSAVFSTFISVVEYRINNEYSIYIDQNKIKFHLYFKNMP